MPETTPRLAHLVWLGSDVPAQVLRLRDEVLRQDPDTEVRIWRDDDLAWLEHRDLFDAETRFPAKADIARYQILLRHGGIYLDADMRVHGSLAPIHDAIEVHGIVVARQSRTLYNNAFLAARPGHPLLRDLVDRIPSSYRTLAGMTAPAVTGPHLLTEGLLAFLRRGGSVFELPQHAVYPWYSDEHPLPTGALPDSVILSHDWASARGWANLTVRSNAQADTPPDRRTRRARTGRSLRARAAATPLAHDLILRLERGMVRSSGSGRVRHPEDRGATPTEGVLEASVARLVARELRGSATFLDAHPASSLPFLAAGRVLDRAGRALLALDDEPAGSLPPDWRDPSIRPSMHVLHGDSSEPDRIDRIESAGSPLVNQVRRGGTVGTVETIRPSDLTLAEVIGAIPRYDLVRIRGERLSEQVSVTVNDLVISRRIRRLVVTIDPASTAPGLEMTIDLLSRLGAAGSPIRIGPWLVDGRGRTWRQQLRVAARPFLALVG